MNHRPGEAPAPKPSRRERIRGCLLGGAIGDAFGAGIEFCSLAEIRAACGRDGPNDYVAAFGRRSAITDDTQMTLFTAEGLIRAMVRSALHGICHPPSMLHRSYQRWLVTQGGRHRSPGPDGWLLGVEGLHHRRAPGLTCLSALKASPDDPPERPLNDSKGCGAVMRSAPFGLALLDDPFGMAVECAALTHGHPSGTISAGALAHMIASLMEGASLAESVERARRHLDGIEHAGEVRARLDEAMALAARGTPTPEDLEMLGGGWTGEEALAIAVCAALGARDMREGLRIAVTHSGDSDSTGAICGNLLGAAWGEAALPADLLADLELADVIGTVADDLAAVFGGAVDVDAYWERYPGA